ncbi:hypothetical protein BJP25_25155 [Actinokineospora bangkokensis]|uniref:Uncharacterized protein n=1 Tax=Actinokineospora bangkokensis TaxID=1193682 RepID=A0A1Q9LI94_9PSEU|nr:hypothetical protein BJP25_25155 [Actinokineospora bangkokensis]
MAVVHAVVSVVVAALKAANPTGQSVLEAISLAVLVGVAAVWAAVDGWREVPDRGRAWVLAALITGVGSAVLSTLGRGLFVDQTGAGQLGEALTGGAAFSALLVLLPAGLGLLVGPRLDPDRRAGDDEDEPAPRRKPSPRPRSTTGE